MRGTIIPQPNSLLVARVFVSLTLVAAVVASVVVGTQHPVWTMIGLAIVVGVALTVLGNATQEGLPMVAVAVLATIGLIIGITVRFAPLIIQTVTR